jgi:hypothetical protein
MSRGGARPGAGRPKGSKSKNYVRRRTRYQEAAVQAARKMEKAGIKPFKGDAHAFLVWAYQNPELDFGLRLEAAKAAAPFEKPRLSSTQVSANTIKRDIAELTREELLAIASGSFQYQNIDAPVKETRDEWLARQMGTTARTPASSNSGDVMH